MKNTTFKLLLAALVFAAPNLARAEVTIFDQNGWKIGLGGFIEFDSFYDTTRSFVETVGNGAVARKGTLDGDNGRTQFSLRNSRLSFNIVPPAVDGWKTRGYLETDFLGFDPSPSASNAPQNSEASFFANPTLRIRHAYIMAETGDLQILVGQTWSLFGWQPAYVLSSISVNPISGTSYQRTPRIGVVKTMALNDATNLQAGLSLERPTQRDGKLPNVVGALRWSDTDRKSGYTGPNSNIAASPMSIGVSGTYRNIYQTTNLGVTSPTVSSSTTEAGFPAFAFAVNALVPILASSDGKDVSNTLTLTGEFTAGRGYGDEFPSWSGGLVQAYDGTTPTGNTDLDAGLGGYTNSGNFDLVKLRTWNAQLQYHLEGKTFFTLGYGQLYSSNMSDFYTAVANPATSKLYDRVESKFVNVGRDFTDHVRLALEFDQFTTHYVSDGATNFDNRYMLASYFRF